MAGAHNNIACQLKYLASERHCSQMCCFARRQMFVEDIADEVARQALNLDLNDTLYRASGTLVQ
jgi:hypothetical protein